MTSCVPVSHLGSDRETASLFPRAFSSRGTTAIEVELTCPNCKSPIDHSPVFETELDETILELVDGMEDVDPTTGDDLREKKAAFHLKRLQYLSAKKKQQQQQQRGQRQEANERASLADEYADYADYIKWALPYLAVAIVAVIVFLRK